MIAIRVRSSASGDVRGAVHSGAGHERHAFKVRGVSS